MGQTLHQLVPCDWRTTGSWCPSLGLLPVWSQYLEVKTFDFLILGFPNMNHHLHYSTIWEFPSLLKFLPKINHLTDLQQSICTITTHILWKLHLKLNAEGIQPWLCYLAGEEYFTVLQNFPRQVLYEMWTWKRTEMPVAVPLPCFLRECFHLVLDSRGAAGNSRDSRAIGRGNCEIN